MHVYVFIVEDSILDVKKKLFEFQKWEIASRNGNGRKFCYDNFMSENVCKVGIV